MKCVQSMKVPVDPVLMDTLEVILPMMFVVRQIAPLCTGEVALREVISVAAVRKFLYTRVCSNIHIYLIDENNFASLYRCKWVC